MIRRLTLAAALTLSACTGHGAEGIAVPPPMDMTAIVRPSSPNTALAAPAGFSPTPDIETHAFSMPPDRLYALVRRVAEAQPRTYLHVAFDDRRQVHYVIRSAVFNFPDLVTVQIRDDGGLVIWSRSVYGESDLGVNCKRVAAWLAAIDAALVPA